MKKLFIFGDAHSFYNELQEALRKNGYEKDNNDHILVSLGDLCDRGPDSVKILKFMNQIPDDRKICIIGNHELLMEDMVSRGFALAHDIYNGTVKTVEQLTGITGHAETAVIDMQQNYLWKRYKKNWIPYAEIGDMIFVHGWIPCEQLRQYDVYEYSPNWRDANMRDWSKATWYNGMKAWSDGVKEDGKTIFCGHWHTSWGHSMLHNYGVEFVGANETVTTLDDGTTWPFACFDPFVDDGIVAVDACTVASHQVNVVVREIEDALYYDYLNSRGAAFEGLAR